MITADLQLLDLPVALLVRIMQHVPLQQRLGVCTLVCHAFHTAAVEATDSVILTDMSRQAQCDNVAQWLQAHGGGVTRLDMRGQGLSLACLPCPALRDLNLQWLSVQPGFFSACTSLTRLLLNDCFLKTTLATQLSVLVTLQHLELHGAVYQRAITNPGINCCEFPGSLLSQLVQLTCLKLRYSQVQSDAALQHLGSLSALQHLELNLEGWGEQKPTAAALTGLQQLLQLTSLILTRVPWAINLHSMPAFTVLAALRVLQLDDCPSVDAAVLATTSQLQQLELGCKDLWNAEGSAAMLAAVGQQQGLTKLRISHYRCWSTPSAAAYSALTASSHVQHLQLIGCEFPAGAWQQMFPPTKCCPELRQLYSWTRDTQVQPLSPADTVAMVSCCPRLDSITLGRHLPVSSATPLQQLTGLTALQLCASFQDSAPSIAQLTGLQNLMLISSGQADQVTVSGLLQLTALQQLSEIGVIAAEAAWQPGLSALVPHGSVLRVSNKVRTLAASPACQTSRNKLFQQHTQPS